MTANEVSQRPEEVKLISEMMIAYQVDNCNPMIKSLRIFGNNTIKDEENDPELENDPEDMFVVEPDIFIGKIR